MSKVYFKTKEGKYIPVEQYCNTVKDSGQWTERSDSDFTISGLEIVTDYELKLLEIEKAKDELSHELYIVFKPLLDWLLKLLNKLINPAK